MTTAVEVGVGYVSVVPSARGFAADLQRQIGRPTVQVGAQLGEQSGAAAGRGMLGSFGGIVKGGIAAIAVGGAALFGTAFSQALEQNKSNARLAAQLGLDPKESQRLGKIAGAVFSKGYGESIDQVNDSLRTLAQNGVVAVNAPRKDVEGLTKSALNLAEAFGADVGASARAAGQLIKTGMVKDAKGAFDLITTGFQSGADKSEDFLDTLNEYGTQFRDLGLNGAQAVGLLTQGLKAGARDGDLIADTLKEFAIRAKDGSDTSAAGFKAIGLSAKEMTAQFAKGGPGAAAGLDLVLDKLRAMPDRVERNAAAVALFGTQSEDLQEALFSLDPSAATGALGKVGGAADSMGKTLHGTATNSFEVFKRTVMQGLVGFITRNVLPAVVAVGTFLITYVLPALQAVGAGFEAWLLPALAAVGSALAAGVGWVREYGAWLLPLGVAVAGLTITMNASAIATGAVTAVFSIYRGVILAAAAVTRGYAIVQGLLNAVMSANPIGLVITSIAALVTLLVVAYNRSDAFRAIVQAAWAGIQAGWAALWSFLQPGFAALMVGLQAIGTVASWLWTTVLSPTFGFIGTAVRILATAVVVLAVLPIVAAVKILGAIFGWLWTAAISPVVGWIVAGAQLLWAGVKLQFDLFMAGVRFLGGVISWLWTNAVQPVLGWIADKAVWLWSQRIKPAWDAIKIGAGLLGAKVKELWSTYVSPALQSIGDKASWLWTNALKPAFDLGKKGLKALADSFGVTKDTIKTAWDAVSGIAKKPIAFLVNTIYNDNLVPTWNAIAGAFGAPKLSKVKGFAVGGPVHGAGTETSDDVPAWLSRNEHVWTAREVRGAGGHGAVMAMRKWAAAGGGPGAPGFATGGGLFDWVKNTASSGVDLAKSGVSWLKDGVKASAVAGLNSVVKPLINQISGSASLYRDMVTRIPRKMIDSIIGYSGKADGELEKAGIGGKGFKAGLAWARTQAGKKYQWGGNGNPSWDCSGLVSAVESVIRGQSPHRRWATGSFSGATAPAGWVLGARSPYMIGITNAGVGHTAGTINGTNIESRGGDGVVVGSRARSYHDPLFTHTYGFKGYADGGSPRPGEIAWVGEDGPELMRFSGGEVIYSHPESMAMAAELGSGVRGFAKGTSSATRKRARSEIPGDLKAITAALSGSAADLSKALGALVKDIRTAGLSGKALSAAGGKAAAKLLSLAKAQDAVQSKLAAAKTAAADQKKTAADFLGIGNFGDASSISDVLTGMRGRQQTASNFAAKIKTLSKKGLSQDLISQLVAMGPDSQLAGVVAGADAGQIKALNGLAKSGAKLSTNYGRTMADSMFDSGKDAGKGFLVGLQSQEKALQAQMNKLGKGMVKAIKEALDSHSPSRKTRAVGRDTGAGLVLGVADMLPQVEAAAAQLGTAAIPSAAAATAAGSLAAPSAAGSPVAAGGAQATAAAALAGLTIRIQVGDREITDIARAEVYQANGELLQVLNAGGGQ
ncbi:Phage-related minor tail protein [Streptomyces sp. ADI97-07]|uniref:phage tail tape measure protein n=1 Tax=Streptomyces sp. ADI97-07 TaxID=1522762 RepID=UPI000FB9C488|nr:phage tail tape measure protein [Streptomyces sp. ADI97-07]RPK76610.1 Phage-related minor tail protein [Streptomyces sp. ADI97-07]